MGEGKYFQSTESQGGEERPEKENLDLYEDGLGKEQKILQLNSNASLQ